MPQSNRQVSDYSLRNDMNSYYAGSVVTHVDKDGVKHAALVLEFRGTNAEIVADVRLLPQESGSGWGAPKRVSLDCLDFTLPPLGLVKQDDKWYHLSRHPARRMRKGYHAETVQYNMLHDREYMNGLDIGDYEVIRQTWYGSDDRITHNIVVWDKDIFYGTDKVASLDDEGNILLIPNKEKLGEFVCKALANNWDLATSKFSVRTLPSSPQMPLE